MTLTIILIGQTKQDFVLQGTHLYLQRLKHYLPVEELVINELKDKKNMDAQTIREKEGASILSHIGDRACLVLMDENGIQIKSRAFASNVQKILNGGFRQCFFLIGGAFGVSEAVKARANYTISLSALTMNHDLARLVLYEQLYRAMTILRNEPYHND